MNSENKVFKPIEEINSIGADIARLTEEAKRKRFDALIPALDAITASGEVSVIVIRGYTPGFNDGEPCKHSADAFVNIMEAIKFLDEVGEFEGIPKKMADSLVDILDASYACDPAKVEENEKICREYGHIYKAPSDSIQSIIYNIIFPVVEDENDTDYYVLYLFKDGAWSIKKGEYDCGY